MRISDWSSDVCSSDLHVHPGADAVRDREDHAEAGGQRLDVAPEAFHRVLIALRHRLDAHGDDDDGEHDDGDRQHAEARYCEVHGSWFPRSEEHTSELQSLMRISYAVFCLNKKNKLITHS